VVVYTGGLLAWKGVDLLVSAARQLPEVRFVIAGGMDADVAVLKQQAADLRNVRFEGFQPPERVATYLAAADLGVVPNRSKPAISSRYTSPLKIFEAMAVGLPLVVSDLPSMRDVLSADEAEFVAPDDALALSAGLRSLLGDAARRRELSEKLRSRAPEATWDARARRILDWMATRVSS
jgi:glycosyltransferase involved in cell wall biosynthesis